jgi:predicted alternative tryptophan synthase beta-subunit
MIELRSREPLARAIERAKARHPRVKVKRFGEYQVTGSAGSLYTVRCERRNGAKVVYCECVAGQFGTACFHAMAAAAVHIGLASLRRAA